MCFLGEYQLIGADTHIKKLKHFPITNQNNKKNAIAEFVS